MGSITNCSLHRSIASWRAPDIYLMLWLLSFYLIASSYLVDRGLRHRLPGCSNVSMHTRHLSQIMMGAIN
jgi:cytochrome c oxidase subunit IV